MSLWKFTPDPSLPCDDPAYCLRIFAVNDDQWSAASKSIAAQSKSSGSQVNVALLRASDYVFWKAEEYQYVLRAPGEIALLLLANKAIGTGVLT